MIEKTSLITTSRKLQIHITPYPYIIIVMFTLINPNKTAAQNDVLIKPDLSTNINIWYDSAIGLTSTVLHLGVLADMTKKTIGTHPYFVDFRWQIGQVTYRNQGFEQVQLIYNIENDILITRGDGLSAYDQYIQLNKSQVLSFQISEFFFKQYDFGSDNINSGFYEVLFEGAKIDFVVRHKKVLKINLESEFEYFEQQEFFILLSNNLYPIKNTSDLAKIFKTNRKPIKDFGKKNQLKKLNYRSYKEYIPLVDYCDELASQL